MTSQSRCAHRQEQTEGTRSQVLRWLKQVGEAVSENEPLIEIETDKVTVEVAAPAAGRAQPRSSSRSRRRSAPGSCSDASPPGAAAAPRARRPPPAARAPPPAPTRRAARAGRRGSLSPAVRRLLAEHGLEARAGARQRPGGRIMVEDVLRAAAGGSPAAAPAAAPRRAGGAAAGAPRACRTRRCAAHRRAHGAEPAAHRAARDHGVRGRHERGARRPRAAPRGVRPRGRAADPHRLLRAGGGGGDPRRAGGQQPLDRQRAGALRGDAHRRRHRGGRHGPRRAGAARCGRARPARDRARARGSGAPRARGAA